ncbi:helix-turn-helix domain-containing protein [Vibrio breoganii]|uniref:HTH cro/C1-type domain-containing protein n=1 Tax=Vibrio breoganii TaxID=553239 RepID=A0AAP8MX55_9VIBR|nr:helix-turn-helix domain-containing protein [Vibrio breoganii]PMP10249.1 hypothetical protein BCS93_11275 [Vibrio breoganii]
MISEDKSKEVGARIREARLARGWSLEELAGRLKETTFGTLSKIELNRTKKLDLFKIEEIAQQLEVSLMYLMYGDDDLALGIERIAVTSETCAPQFLMGDKITIDCNAEIATNDYVVVEGESRDIRQYLEFEGEVLLKATNPAIPAGMNTRTLKDNETILGRIIHQARFY